MSQASVLNSLSYDAMLEVISLLNAQELGRLAQVSREAQSVADDEVVWRRCCRELQQEWVKILGKSVPPPEISADDDAWKDTFRTERKRVVDAAKFVGSWSEKWCDVNVPQSTIIESDGYNFTVIYKKNKFTSRFLDCDGDTMSFHLEGGDSSWTFVYTLKYLSDGLLQLTVFRTHDKKTFTGVFTRG